MHTHTPLFDLKHLSVSYRARPALRGIHWTWMPGEHWALLGPNGAGKSTLAAVLSGEQKHFAGDFTRSERLAAGGIAYVGFEQSRQLCERDRKRDCAEYESSGVDTGTRVHELLAHAESSAQKYRRLITLLGLEPILDRGLRYISTGEMRKTLLASALLREPALLILDSPMDGLDAATQRNLGQALDTIIQESPAVLVLCRSAEEVPAACGQLMLLDRGRQLAKGERGALLGSDTVRELLAPPAMDFSVGAVTEAPQTPGAPEATDPRPATIELREVTARFGDVCVFRDVNWRLEAHEHCLIAGPNGSGKSTLLDLLTGDNHKAYGQDVRLFGRRRGEGESVWDIKALFGRVDARMQFAVPSGSSVLDVVVSGFYDSLGLRDRPSDRQRGAAKAWSKALGLDSWCQDEFHTLSFGLQRLVLLARAMVKNPAILLLDEATLSLDAGHRALLLAAVDHVVEAGGCQLLFVSHTASDRPRCINQVLHFEPHPDGSRVSVSHPSGEPAGHGSQ